MSEVVHITADFPDHKVANKTRAVQSLIELTPELRHRVYSFNRAAGVRGVRLEAADDGLTTLTYRALPYGLLLRFGLAPLSRWIVADLRRRGTRPRCIHAHKLTIDGLVALPVAQALGCPLVCSVWGNTDQKVIQRKPELRTTFRAVADAASHLLPAAPWVADYVETKLGAPRSKMTLLPVVSRVGRSIPSRPTGAGFVTVFNLDGYRHKNVRRLIAALGCLIRRGHAARLDIYGGGSPEAMRAVVRLIEASRLGNSVRLMGPVDHAMVQEVISRYSAFVLPSLRETFGMVFVEALFSGVPILYPQGAALDGYFTDVSVGYRCRARNLEDIANGLEALMRHEAELKRSIAELHENGFFRIFQDEEIAARYLDVVERVS